jgi:hypothetical protein
VTQEELEALGREWQKRLRLLDFEIAFRLEKYFRMTDEVMAFNGEVPHAPNHKKAVVRVRETMDYGDSILHHALTETHEHVLIHELLELHFSPFKVTQEEDAPKHVAQECAINMIACGLLRTKYGATDEWANQSAEGT